MILALLYLLFTIVARRFGPRRVAMLLLLPFIALDCAGNWLLFGNSLRFTISGEAWNQREAEGLQWCWQAIDAAFGEGHCRIQCEREALHGGVWAAWLDEWRG